MNVRVQSVGDVMLTGEKELLREKKKRKKKKNTYSGLKRNSRLRGETKVSLPISVSYFALNDEQK